MTEQAVLFPGQGAQFVGMSADLIRRCRATETLFQQASEMMGLDLYALLTDGPEQQVNSTAVSQPAIFTVSLAVIRLLEESGMGDRLQAMATAGLSLGEYSALVFAGAVKFEDALEVVVKRGQFMQEACDAQPSSMTAILGLELDAVSEVVAAAASAGVVAVANVNAKTQIVISGEIAALEKAAELATERGARRAVPLTVAGAYHSPIMASATEKLRPYLERLSLETPRIPFYNNVTAQRVEDPEEIRQGLIRQVESSVLWAPTLERLLSEGMKSVFVPGPGRELAGLVKQVDRRMPVSAVLTEESVHELTA